MSGSSSSPVPRSAAAPAFDGSTFYDPDFTVEISNRMRVPDKISVLNDDDMINITDGQKDRLTSHAKGKGSNEWMRVPERILVAGNDSHIAGIQPPPELKLENTIRGDDQYTADIGNTIQMMTPPRVLSLSDHAYPSVTDPDDEEDSDDVIASKRRSNVRGSGLKQNQSQLGKMVDWSLNDSTMNGLDVADANVVRRQLKMLNRRVTHLEQENRMRYQREVIIYSLGVLYLIIKSVSWFNRRSW
jgi:hypothetical protein